MSRWKQVTLISAYKKLTPRQCRDKYLRHKYGITFKQQEQMRLEQGGRCAICLRSDRRLDVDHDHRTGKVRQLLCTLCNQGIGDFGDDVEMLRRAIDYLRKHA